MAEGTEPLYDAKLKGLSVQIKRNERGGAIVTVRDRYEDMVCEDFGPRQMDELVQFFEGAVEAVREYAALKRQPDGTLHPLANLIRETQRISRMNNPVLCDGISSKEASL